MLGILQNQVQIDFDNENEDFVIKIVMILMIRGGIKKDSFFLQKNSERGGGSYLFQKVIIKNNGFLSPMQDVRTNKGR